MLIIVGLLNSVLGTSKRDALITDDISKLRQIGLAASIYESDFDGSHPLSTQPLLSNGRIEGHLVQSALDPTREGWLNLIVLSMSKTNPNFARRLPATRVSFTGTGDLFRGKMRSEVQSSPGAGWLIAFSTNRSANVGMPEEMLEGPFLRLTFEGAVVRRKSAERNRELVYIDLFRDPL
ncbi:MAG: hypothetical protein LCH41_04255 [Armatimonadetes bacterium]|nr:hypothetical protein [Armatimonadota bacterium]